MKTRPLSASSIESWEKCQLQYYISRILGVRTPSGLGAARGLLFHAAVELCLNDRGNHPKDYIQKALVTLGKEEQLLLTKDAQQEVHQWLQNHELTFLKHKKYEIIGTEIEFNLIYEKVNDRFYRIDNILGPEYYLGLPIDKHFIIKGFIDLVLRDKDGVIHIVDWKTGQKKYAKLSDELYFCWQPRIYYMAATELWKATDYVITFDYIHSHHSPVHFGPEVKQEVLASLYNVWMEIATNKRPNRFNKENFVCKYLCGLGYHDGHCNDTWQKLNNGQIEV